MSNQKNQDLPAFFFYLYDYKRMQKDIEMILIPLNVFSNYAYCVKISNFISIFTMVNLWKIVYDVIGKLEWVRCYALDTFDTSTAMDSHIFAVKRFLEWMKKKSSAVLYLYTFIPVLYQPCFHV